MKTFRNYAFKLAGGALVLGALAIGTPKAAHAVAAAMVQIVNTAANPAITHETALQASQLIYLTTTFATTINGDTPFQPYMPGGSVGPNFTVPAGQSLVVTAIDLTSNCNGTTLAELDDSGGQYFMKSLNFSGPQYVTNHFTYPSGLVFAGGYAPSLINRANGNCSVGADLHGYLTAQ
jgi:hypothetical protein